MPRLAYISLLCCLLMTLAGCEKYSNVQTSSNSQPAASPQASSTASTTTTTTTTTTTAAVEQPPQPASGENAVQGKPKFDACTLLTKAEIESVQGEAVRETKNDGRNDGGMSISQCFYAVANFSKSVSLAVTQPDPDNSSKTGPRDFWKRTFHRDDEKDREREREKKGEKKDEKERERESAQPTGRGEEEGEESAPPKKITGVGEEAYWTGSRVGGALYVLKKNAFIRISVGGPGNEEEKINKSKALAQKALKRL
ncbi:MAG TPA: hypothetical protein VGO91_03535 [Pyrinomonadaceae bacterium]|nr:hypothetical protein [Pyrinomonadaceae bacterium]